MNVLLTGASSFTGFWFATKLAEAGHKVVTPMSREPGRYEGVRAERMQRLSLRADVIANCAYGSPEFIELVGKSDFDVLCLHDPDPREDCSADIEVTAALAPNASDVQWTLQLMRERGLRAVVVSMSLFGSNRGAQLSSRRAFSSRSPAERYSFENLKHWGDVLGVSVSKFILPDAFGPFEDPRFIDYVLRRWAEGRTAEMRRPHHLCDNIHVDLLALAYADFVGRAGQGQPARRIAPRGYVETQGAFAERLARELAPRLGYDGRVPRVARPGIAESQARFNADAVGGAASAWREDLAWDAVASYYRRKGFAGTAAKPSALVTSSHLTVELSGAIDVATHTLASGWMTDRGGANPRFARVFVDGRELGCVRADLFRQDLKEREISDGASGFRFVFPAPLDPYRDHIVRIEDRDSGKLFGPQPVTLKKLIGGPDSPFGVDRHSTAVYVASADYDAEGVSILLVVFGRAAGFSQFVTDDAEFEELGRVAIADRFFAEVGLQVVRLKVRARPRADATTIMLRFAEAEGLGTSDRLACENLVPSRMPDYLDCVTKENMERVSGPGVSTGAFAAGGLATAHRIDAMVRLHFGRGLRECGRCLDWGAGAGRVATPLTRIVAPGLALTAADVDRHNVAFGRAHCPGIDFVEAPFMPPLPFPDGAFGAIYGVSVFTHLTKAAQFAWLAELRRLVPSGAPVVVSVHNDFASLRTSESAPAVMAELLQQGISDQLHDDNLGPKLLDTNYYRSTFHTRRYVREQWTRDFEIENIFSFGNGSTQDFVVLRAK